jgi:hypothetical protein
MRKHAYTLLAVVSVTLLLATACSSSSSTLSLKKSHNCIKPNNHK